jgi:hypothetical protein
MQPKTVSRHGGSRVVMALHHRKENLVQIDALREAAGESNINKSQENTLHIQDLVDTEIANAKNCCNC